MAYINVVEWTTDQVTDWLKGKAINIYGKQKYWYISVQYICSKKCHSRFVHIQYQLKLFN